MRLESAFIWMVFLPISSAAFGWVSEKHVHVAAVCVFLFLAGFFSMWVNVRSKHVTYLNCIVQFMQVLSLTSSMQIWGDHQLRSQQMLVSEELQHSLPRRSQSPSRWVSHDTYVTRIGPLVIAYHRRRRSIYALGRPHGDFRTYYPPCLEERFKLAGASREERNTLCWGNVTSSNWLVDSAKMPRWLGSTRLPTCSAPTDRLLILVLGYYFVIPMCIIFMVDTKIP